MKITTCLGALAILAAPAASWSATAPEPAPSVGRLVAQVHTMRRMSVSVAGMLQAGKEPVVEASIVKDIGTVWEQQLPHRVRDRFDIGFVGRIILVGQKAGDHARRGRGQDRLGGTRGVHGGAHVGEIAR